MLKKVILGFTAGVISGLFTAGGGLLLVPIFVHFMRLNEKTSRATSLFCILPMVITTAFFYNKSNLINWEIGIKCAIGGIIGGLIGAKLLTKMSDKYLRITLYIFLLYSGVNMIIK